MSGSETIAIDADGEVAMVSDPLILPVAPAGVRAILV
jgi:hypothetical protein